MQFRDLKTQYNVLKDEMDKAILDVVASSAYVMGPKIKEMESAFAEYVGVKHCVACNSGTDALLLALKAWDVKPGDAVFVPSFTFFASAEVIAMQGATPVFVDVDKDTFNMDVVDLERKIEQTLKAGQLTPRVIIAVDLFGLPADFKAIRKIADRYGLYVEEVDGDVCLRVNLRDSQQAAELHRMLYEWQAAANALRKGEITQEAYDQWRYNFPDGDTTRRWVRVPPQGLMDDLVAGLQENPDSDHK